MKRIIYLLILFLTLTNFAVATELQVGGVSFDVNSAREYVQEGQRDNVEISGPSKFEPNKIEKFVYSYNNNNEVVGITVQYANEPDKAYIYDKNKNLIYVEKYDKPINIYPHRGYRYKLDGKLDLTSLSVSKDEHFRFSPNGRLIAHSINGTIYDESGNVIGSGRQ